MWGSDRVEGGKCPVEVVEDPIRETPQVHRYDLPPAQVHVRFTHVTLDRPAAEAAGGFALDSLFLHDVEIAVGGRHADASSHRRVSENGLTELVTDDHVLVWQQHLDFVSERLHGGEPIKVVRVHDTERGVDEHLRRGDGLRRAGDWSLGHQRHLDLFGPKGRDVIKQLGADLVSHHEQDVVEAGLECVARRVVHDGLARRADGCELLQPSETTTVTCCHDH